MSYNELIAESKTIFNSFSVTTEQVKHLELITRKQSKCTAWYEYRAGRVTASKMKSAAFTNVPRGKWYCPDCKPQFKSTK